MIKLVLINVNNSCSYSQRFITCGHDRSLMEQKALEDFKDNYPGLSAADCSIDCVYYCTEYKGAFCLYDLRLSESINLVEVERRLNAISGS